MAWLGELGMVMIPRGVGGEGFDAQSEAGIRHRFAAFIKDTQGLRGGGAVRKDDEPALADQRAGGNLAADEIDEPCAGTFEFRQGDGFPMLDDRCLCIGDAAFVVGHQTVEIEVHLRFGAVAREVGRQVEFIDADQQVRRVLEIERRGSPRRLPPAIRARRVRMRCAIPPGVL